MYEWEEEIGFALCSYVCILYCTDADTHCWKDNYNSRYPSLSPLRSSSFLGSADVATMFSNVTTTPSCLPQAQTPEDLQSTGNTTRTFETQHFQSVGNYNERVAEREVKQREVTEVIRLYREQVIAWPGHRM